MSGETQTVESAVPVLTLFVTGDAPRSRRARRNLATALSSVGLESLAPMEIDLLDQPEKTVSYSVFATPALLRMDGEGKTSVLYGDLSNEEKLLDFLRDIDGWTRRRVARRRKLCA